MPIDTVPTTQKGIRDIGGNHYRYPGSPPFQDTELHRRLFKGRAKEADHVLHSILSSDLFLLYSVSGLGKTSLLNAGVMHGLRGRGYWPVSVRLNDVNKPPAEQIREQIEQAAATDPGIEILPNPDAPQGVDTNGSLWELLTSIEVWRVNELQEIVLILDQFEELFTLGWDEEQQRAFIADFGEVVRGHRTRRSLAPGRFQPAPDVKIVLAMREDALGELEALAADVPQIMANRFRLGPLDPIQAEHAIREPAALDDPRLGSQRFKYTAAAAKELLNFLRTKTLNGSTIETAAVDPSQLQIVCQYVERAIVPEKAAAQPPDSVVEIDDKDLGGKAGLNRILSDFYGRTIESFPARAQSAVRDLCENGLISRSDRRLSLEEGEVEASHRVSPEMLQQLVDARLLRSEPRVGSVYYELAHDTLVRPILVYRDLQRQKRARRRLRWVGIAAAVAVVAIALGFFLIGISRSGAADLEAQENATQQAALAAEAAANAERAAELATEALDNAIGAAEEKAEAAVEERENAVEALEQARDAAENAQLQDAAAAAQSPAEYVEIGRAAAATGEAAFAAAVAAAGAARDEAEKASDAATKVEEAADGAAQEEGVEEAQAAAANARAEADAAGGAVAVAVAAADAAGSAVAAAEAAADAAQARDVVVEAEAAQAEAAITAAAAAAAADAADAAAAAGQVPADGETEPADTSETATEESETAEGGDTTAQRSEDEALDAVLGSEKEALDAVANAQEAFMEAQIAADAAATWAAAAVQSAQIPLPTIKLAQGEKTGEYYWYVVELSGFEANTSVAVTCRSTANPTGFYTGTVKIGVERTGSEDKLCFSLPDQDHWVTGGGVESEPDNW